MRMAMGEGLTHGGSSYRAVYEWISHPMVDTSLSGTLG